MGVFRVGTGVDLSKIFGSKPKLGGPMVVLTDDSTCVSQLLEDAPGLLPKSTPMRGGLPGSTHPPPLPRRGGSRPLAKGGNYITGVLEAEPPTGSS